MSIDRADFENICEADVTELLTSQVPENLKLDYKVATYGTSDADKRELLKDISAFANAYGGHLVIGVEEAGGVPTSIPGCATANIDAEILRMDEIVRNGLEPRIQNVRIVPVALENGRICIVARIPNSWQKPHRVITQNSNRFFIRNARNVTEPNVAELRMLFSQSGTILEQARAFRDARIEAILQDNPVRSLLGNGRLIMHIVPLAAVSGFQVDLERIRAVHERLRPIGAMGYSPDYNLDGFILARGGEENRGYTQIFRNGVLEATKASLITATRQGSYAIAGIGLERQIFEVFDSYIGALRAAEVPAPLMISFVLEGVGSAYYAVNNDSFDDRPAPLGRPLIILPECVIEDFGDRTTYHSLIKPAFDALWNASGFSSAQSFSIDGQWIGRPGSG